MIISHQYKFIFLKTNKTAGTSIEIALSKFLGPDDIITPISPEDEVTRSELGCRGAQNYLASLPEYRWTDVATLIGRRKLKKRFYNHISAADVRALVGEEIWRSYYKFCFERDPWDRFVSLYYWIYKSEPRPSIQEFLDSDRPLILKRRGYELYTINRQLAVDKVCRFEKLAEELEEVRLRVGLPEPLILPRAKSRFRSDKRSPREILSESQQAQIAEIFKEEIEMFGYRF